MSRTTLITRVAAALCSFQAIAGCAMPAGEAEQEPAAQTEQGILSGQQIVTGETSVGTAATRQLSVACPVGTKALGAGFAALDGSGAILDGIATYSMPSWDGTSWLVNAKVTAGSPSWKLKVSLTCSNAAALAGYLVTMTDSATSSASTKQHSATCPAGTLPTGAGFGVLDGSGVILPGEATYFAPNEPGWLVNVRYVGRRPWKIRLAQICVNSAALPGYEVVSEDTVASSLPIKQLTVACPAGKLASGAGFGVLDPSGAILDGSALYSAPSWDGATWMTNASNNSGWAPSFKLRSKLVCL